MGISRLWTSPPEAMTAYKFTSHRQLRDILNNVEQVQKINIDEYSWGHLNEKKLYRPPNFAQQGRIWKSSKKRKTAVKDSDLLAGLPINSPSSPRATTQGKEMKDVLFEFSVGTMGSVPMPSPVKTNTPPRLDKIEEFRRETSEPKKEEEKSVKSSRDNSAKSLYSQIDDGILVEELPNQEMMVESPRLPHTVYRPKKLRPSDVNYDIMADLTQTLDADGFLTLKHSFLPSFTSGVTKSDQYNKLCYFEDTVLRKQDCREQNVLSGTKAVQHLERRLEEVRPQWL